MKSSCPLWDLWRFCVVALLFGFFRRSRSFCHRTESDLFLFLLIPGPFANATTELRRLMSVEGIKVRLILTVLSIFRNLTATYGRCSKIICRVLKKNIKKRLLLRCTHNFEINGKRFHLSLSNIIS